MKALQRALGRFGIESPCRHVVGCEVIQQRPRYRGLADAALVRSYNDHRWLGHGRSFGNPAPPGAALCSASLIYWIAAARRKRVTSFSPSRVRRVQRFYTGRVLFGKPRPVINCGRKRLALNLQSVLLHCAPLATRQRARKGQRVLRGPQGPGGDLGGAPASAPDALPAGAPAAGPQGPFCAPPMGSPC